MIIKLAYGESHLAIDFPDACTTVIEPAPIMGLPDDRASVMAALDSPVGAKPLRQLIQRNCRVAIVFTDITRATPNRRLIPWLLAYLSELVVPENITLLNALGTHRPNTCSELERLLTPEVVANYHVLNHEPEEFDAHVQVGVTVTVETERMQN